MAPEVMELPHTRREVSSLVIKAYVVSLLLLLSVLVWSVGDAWAQFARDVYAVEAINLLAVTKGRRRRGNAVFGGFRKVGVLGMVLSIGKFFRLQASGDEHEDRHKITVQPSPFLPKMGKRAGGNGPLRSWTMVIAKDPVHLQLSSPARMQVRVDRDYIAHSEDFLKSKLLRMYITRVHIYMCSPEILKTAIN